ncbi:MAG: proline dehydrogenase family protein [Bryobacteraceae bacterium]
MLMRHFFLYLSQQRNLRHWMETSRHAGRLTERFIAGVTLDDATAVCQKLNAEGYSVALDYLGENVTSLDEAQGSLNNYLLTMDRIAQRQLDSDVSIKITQFGVDLSTEACLNNVRALAAKAKAIGSRVEIDMESTRYTDRTLQLAARIAEEFGCVRCVIQAYLHRSEEDIAFMNAHKIPVRLCKGAYDEPPSVAIPAKPDVDSNYAHLMRILFDQGTFPAIATHDEKLIHEALRCTKERNIGRDQFEFQMLYGIRRDLQKMLVEQGYRLRLYVPYGTAWYPYFMRRLAERPANVWFLLKNLAN